MFWRKLKPRNIDDLLIRQGDIVYADLGKGEGSEQGGIRPCLILQNDIGNKFGPTVIVAAITSEIKNTNLPTHIVIENYKEVGLTSRSMIMFEQIRTIDKKRIDLSKPFGHIDFEKIIEPFFRSFGLTTMEVS